MYLIKIGKLIKTVFHAVGKHQATHIISAFLEGSLLFFQEVVRNAFVDFY